MKRAKVDLPGLMERVEGWRQEREHVRARAPEELWDAAVDVARREGVYATAKAIRFDCCRLKARMEMGKVPRQALLSRADATSFVEIEIPSLGARVPTSSIVVEVVGRHGDRMRIVGAPGAVDVVGLAQAFWSRAS